jgi:hypothetical protein
MPASTPVGRMRRVVEQLLKEAAEAREHLQSIDLREADRLQRRLRSKGTASPTLRGNQRHRSIGRDRSSLETNYLREENWDE